jgi:hypothetical protein
MNLSAPQPRQGWLGPDPGRQPRDNNGGASSGGADNSRTSADRHPRRHRTGSRDPGVVERVARGDVRAAARYFALPSLMINGPDPAGDVVLLAIRTRAEAVAANAGLPLQTRCSRRRRWMSAASR